MKKTLILFVLIFTATTAQGAEVIVDYSNSLNTEANILSLNNIHAVYTFTTEGTKRIMGKPRNFFFRGLEIGLSGILASKLHKIGHEGAHAFSAEENGAWKTKIFLDHCTYWGDFSNQDYVKISMAGLNWENKSAENSIVRSIGKEMSATELLWFGINQQCLVTTSLFNTDKLENYSNPKKDSNDLVKWIMYLGDSEDIREKLYTDIRRGAMWQSLGLFVPAYYGLNYWVTGEEKTMPNFWANPQCDMTDTGVLYALGIWYKTEKNFVIHARPGYGVNRNDDESIMSLELGISGFKITEKIEGSLKCGFSKTLNDSYSVEASVEKSFTPNFAVGISGNYYSGYHRENPSSDESWGKASLFCKFIF